VHAQVAASGKHFGTLDAAKWTLLLMNTTFVSVQLALLSVPLEADVALVEPLPFVNCQQMRLEVGTIREPQIALRALMLALAHMDVQFVLLHSALIFECLPT